MAPVDRSRSIIEVAFSWRDGLAELITFGVAWALVTGPGGKQIILDDPSGNPVEVFEPRPQ